MNKGLKVIMVCLFIIIGLSSLMGDLKNNITIYTPMPGLAYTDRNNGQMDNAHLLNDGDYLLSIAKSGFATYLLIVKTDQNGSYRRCYLNTVFSPSTDRLSYAKHFQSIEIQPFQSDYIENDISTEKTDPSVLSGMKNYYFLHVQNGYGVVFQRQLNIPYTSDDTELLLKIHAAALVAGYITE